MVKRVEKVLYAVEEGTRKLDLLRFEESIQDLTIASVSSRTGISLNNLSTELKILFKKGMLVRVAGRPVVYLSLPLLEEKIGRTIPVNEFQGLGELRKYLFPEKQIEHADRKVPSGRSQRDGQVGGRYASGGCSFSFRPFGGGRRTAWFLP